MKNKISAVSPLIINRKNALRRNQDEILCSALMEFSDNEVSRICNRNKEIHFNPSKEDKTLTISATDGVYMKNLEQNVKSYFNHDTNGVNSEYNNSKYGGGIKNAMITLCKCDNGEIGQAYIGTMGIDGKYPKFKIGSFSFKACANGDEEEFFNGDVYDGDMNNEEQCKKFNLSDGDINKYGTSFLLKNVEDRVFDKDFEKILMEELRKSYMLIHHLTNLRVFVGDKEVDFSDNTGILKTYDEFIKLNEEEYYFLEIDNIFVMVHNIAYKYQGVERVQKYVCLYNYANRLSNCRTPMKVGGLWCELGGKFINCGGNDCEQFATSDSRKGGLGNCNAFLHITNDDYNPFRFNIEKSLGIDPIKENRTLKECVTNDGRNLFEVMNTDFIRLRTFNTEVAKGVKNGVQKDVDVAYQIFLNVMKGNKDCKHNVKSGKGYVYALKQRAFASQNGKSVLKIGFSTNIEKRLKELNTAVPYDFEILCMMEVVDYREVESYFHKKYASCCTAKNKEFFALNESDVFDDFYNYCKTNNIGFMWKGNEKIGVNIQEAA